MSLKLRLLMVLLTVAIILMVVGGSIMFRLNKASIQNQLMKDCENLISHSSNGIYNFVSGHVDQARIASLLPPIQGLIRTQTETIDPIDGSSSRHDWKTRLRISFSAILKSQQHITRARYLDKDGNEIIRVDSMDEVIHHIPDDKLQNKQNTDYFRETQKLQKNDVYVSTISLNIEHGKIEIPHKPVIRITIPIFDDSDGSREGIIVLNILTSELLDFIENSDLGKNIMIDQDGHYLLHPDIEKRYSVSLGTGYNYFVDQPEWKENSKNLKFKNHHDIEEREFRIWRKIFYNPNDMSKYWVLSSVIHEDTLFAPIEKLKKLSIPIAVIVLVIVSFIAFGIAYFISQPIIKLTEASDEISKGNMDVELDDSKSQHELGRLTQSFNVMRKSLQERQIRLEESEQRLRGIITTAVDAVIMINRKGVMQSFNPAAERMFGYSQNEVLVSYQ